MIISPIKIWRRQKEIRTLLYKKGTIVSWTMIYTPPDGFAAYAPYPVVLVEFDRNQKAYGQLVDYDPRDMHIGKTVISVLRKVRCVSRDDVIAYGIKFKPI
ncbi:MAG: OB-fold domain-containing protein [Patescibacteria group bacterium]